VKDVKFAKTMNVSQKEYVRGQVQWLMPVIPDTQEAETRSITIQGQPQ
jgi:hypothetical protein